MVNRKLFCASIILAMIIMPLVIAVDTQIHIKTIRDAKISIQILDPNQVYYLLNSFHVPSGETGETNVTYTGNEDLVNIKAQVSENGNAVMNERFDNIKTGAPIYLQILPGNMLQEYMNEKNSTEAVSLENESIANETETGENATLDIGITGQVSSEGDSWLKMPKIPKMIYFIFAGIIAALLVVLFVVKPMIKFLKKDSAYSYKPISFDSKADEDTEKELVEAEEKIRTAQEKLNKLKRIKDIENRIEADKRELDNLKKARIEPKKDISPGFYIPAKNAGEENKLG